MEHPIRTTLIFFLLFFTFSSGSAQEDNAKGLLVQGIVTHEGMRMEDANILVYDSSNRVVDIQRSERDGSFKVHLSLDGYYVIEFRQKGMITKRLLFRTHTPDHEKSYHPFKLEIAMIDEERIKKAKERIDMDLPLGIVDYFPEKKDFDYVQDYTIARLKDQSQLLSGKSF